jgi:excisionase family DNA binding protein
MQVQKICHQCSREFTARTTVTKYCSDKCSKRGYKDRKRAEKIAQVNTETQNIKLQPLNVLKQKEFLTASDLAQLLNCSVRTVYYQINNGTIKATNLGQRLTRIKRSELDRLFKKPQNEVETKEPEMFDISECYTTEQVRNKYGIAESTLREVIIRNNIPKFRKGWYAYVPEQIIDELLK